MIYATVGLISLASLAYEVLLPRIFSFTQWHHLSFLVISVVVFGFGAGGALTSLAEARRSGLAARVLEPARPERLAGLTLLFSLAAAGSLFFLLRVRLDYFRIPVEPRQAGYLALTYLLLLLPFLFAGGVQALAFAALPGRSGWLYAAGMAGSACGAALPLLLLAHLGEARLVLACAVLPLLPWIFGPLRPGARGSVPWAVAGGALAASALLAALGAAGGRALELRPSAYKLLAQALQFPKTRVLRTENDLRGRVDWLESPALRFTPGMSLAFPGGLPERELAVVDGDGLFLFYPLDRPERLEFSRFSSSYAAYWLSARLDGKAGDVLLLLESGGLSLPCAVSAGARSITVMVRHPALARYLQRRYRGIGLEAASGNPRGFLGRTDRLFDLIQVESWGPSVPGMASLAQDPLLTREAFIQYLSRLSQEGLLTLSRRIHLPPSDSLRLFADAYTALARLGVPDPAAQVVMLRAWDSYTLVVSRRPFSPLQLQRFRQFCRERSFDPLFLEGLGEEEANRFNLYERPFHYLELESLRRALDQGRPQRYYGRYLLDLRPATDERPFPNRFTRWLRIGELYRATGSRLYSLLLSGEVVLLATLALALALGLPLLVLPRRLPGGGSLALGLPRWLYFLAGGSGFMLVELGLVQDFTNLLADPVLAVALVLAGLLIASGVGSAASSAWPLAGLRATAVALVVMLAVLVAARPWLLGGLLRLPELSRAAGELLLLAAFGFLLGVPLPVGLRLLAPKAGQRAYAWTVNGIFSVLASVLALPLAMSAGIRSVYLAGAGCYVLVLIFSLCAGTTSAELREER
jgi:hypothetical protein